MSNKSASLRKTWKGLGFNITYANWSQRSRFGRPTQENRHIYLFSLTTLGVNMGDRIRPSKSSSAGRLLERGEALSVPTPKHSYFILVGESSSIEYSLSGPKWKASIYQLNQHVTYYYLHIYTNGGCNILHPLKNRNFRGKQPSAPEGTKPRPFFTAVNYLLECRPVATSWSWSLSMGDQCMSYTRIFCGAKAIPTSLLVSSSPRNN